MIYLVDLGDGGEPIRCSTEERALFVAWCWQMISSSDVSDVQLAVRELRETIAELHADADRLNERMARPESL